MLKGSDRLKSFTKKNRRKSHQRINDSWDIYGVWSALLSDIYVFVYSCLVLKQGEVYLADLWAKYVYVTVHWHERIFLLKCNVVNWHDPYPDCI